MVVDNSTSIQRRGPGSSGDATVVDLTPGTTVDVRGRFLNGMLRADRVQLGDRQEGRIEFEGVITSVDGNMVFVDTESGAVAVVLITDNTEVRGNLIPGAFVEVEGLLNDQLWVVAEQAKVDDDGDRDADDDNSDDDNDAETRIETGREIQLRPVNSGSGLEGKAEIKFKEEDGPSQQELEVEIEDAPANTAYAIRVEFPTGSVDFGTITTNEFGRAEVEFDTSPDVDERDLLGFIPSGQDVRDIIRVQVTLDGSLVLEGSF